MTASGLPLELVEIVSAQMNLLLCKQCFFGGEYQLSFENRQEQVVTDMKSTFGETPASVLGLD